MKPGWGHRGLHPPERRDFGRKCANAHAIAERLAQHPKVAALCYQVAASHPAHRRLAEAANWQAAAF